MSFECNECKAKFTRKDILKTHMNSHNGITYPCTRSSKVFTRKNNLGRHITTIHRKVLNIHDSHAVTPVDAAAADVNDSK